MARPSRGDCPKCGAPATDRETVKAFGGHEDELCTKCGHRFEPERPWGLSGNVRILPREEVRK